MVTDRHRGRNRSLWGHGCFVVASTATTSWLEPTLKEQRRENRRVGCPQVVRAVIRHRRDPTTTTFHPNRVIDVHDARLILGKIVSRDVVTAYRSILTRGGLRLEAGWFCFWSRAGAVPASTPLTSRSSGGICRASTLRHP